MICRSRLLPLIVLLFSTGAIPAAPNPVPTPEHDDHGEAPVIEQGTGKAACINGVSGGFPCKNIMMLSRLSLEELGGEAGNDSWGWKDSETGSYYALIGMDSGVGIVDVTDPVEPVIIGRLNNARERQGFPPPFFWRDMKTYKDHLFVVSDDTLGHGMQVFDLTRLRDANPPEEFTHDKVYSQFGTAHNIAINEDSGFAYVVGSDTCDGGLHMVEINDPKSPQNAGCFNDDGYTHDVQCVDYHGPDEAFDNREICFAANEDSLTIVDVTNKSNPKMIGKVDYPGVAFSHQGWLSKDQGFFVMGDELDEQATGSNARTLVFDVRDLEQPEYAADYISPNGTIDHNQYVRGNFIYQANYTAGLRILLVENMSAADFREVAFFDTFPALDQRSFQGAWNVYPFFDNGVILVSDRQAGLFVLRAELPAAENAPINGRLTGAWITPGLNDQGLTLFVGENINGPYVFFAWFLFLNGDPFWLSGDTAFEYGVDAVDIPSQRLEGLDFISPGEDLADRIDVGTLHLHAHGCNLLHLEYDFGEELGSGELEMDRLVGVQGRECPASD